MKSPDGLFSKQKLQYEACTQYFEGLDLTFATKAQILNSVEQGYINA